MVKLQDIIFEVMERFAPRKILKKNPDPEYYNREVKRLKVKVRRVYNKRKFVAHYQEELTRLSKDLLVAKRKAQEIFLRSVLQNDGNCWQSSSSMLKGAKEIEKISR